MSDVVVGVILTLIATLHSLSQYHHQAAQRWHVPEIYCICFTKTLGWSPPLEIVVPGPFP